MHLHEPAFRRLEIALEDALDQGRIPGIDAGGRGRDTEARVEPREGDGGGDGDSGQSGAQTAGASTVLRWRAFVTIARRVKSCC